MSDIVASSVVVTEQSQGNDIERALPVPPPATISASLVRSSSATWSDASFVDLILPSPPKNTEPYPAKYKSWLKVLVFVFFADWFSTEAGLVLWLQDTLSLSRNGALLVFLTLVVFVLLYSALDVWNYYLCPGPPSTSSHSRIQWVKEYNNVPVECLAALVTILEDGFRMFDTPPDPLLAANNNSNVNVPLFDQDQGDGTSGECTLKIQQKIRSDKVLEFQVWRKRLLQTMGVLDDKPKYGVLAVHWNPDDEGEDQVTMITFQSIDDLNAYMHSPVRMRFLRHLQPFLAAPARHKIRHQHPNNAITDLCHAQGQERPVNPPKKWKVWVVTTMALYVVVVMFDGSHPHYLENWWRSDATAATTASTVTNLSERLVAQLFRNMTSTFLNSYIALPFTTMIFRHWLHRPDDDDEEDHQPWIFLSDGAESLVVKVAISIALYGGMALAWYLNQAK